MVQTLKQTLAVHAEDSHFCTSTQAALNWISGCISTTEMQCHLHSHGPAFCLPDEEV